MCFLEAGHEICEVIAFELAGNRGQSTDVTKAPLATPLELLHINLFGESSCVHSDYKQDTKVEIHYDPISDSPRRSG